jgi:hypothetical protein
MLSFPAANHTTYARRLHVNTETVSSHVAQWGLFRIVPQRMKRKSSAVLAWKRFRREQKRRSFLVHKGCCCSCRWGEAMSLNCGYQWAYYSYLRQKNESGEPRWNGIDRWNPKYSERNLSQCHFVQHKSHKDWPERESKPRLWEFYKGLHENYLLGVTFPS